MSIHNVFWLEGCGFTHPGLTRLNQYLYEHSYERTRQFVERMQVVQVWHVEQE